MCKEWTTNEDDGEDNDGHDKKMMTTALETATLILR